MVLNPNPPSSTTYWYERRENRPWIFGGLAVLVLVLSLLVVLWSRRNRDTETAAQHLADAKGKVSQLRSVNDTVAFPRKAFSDKLTGAIADLQAALDKKNELPDTVVFGVTRIQKWLKNTKADVDSLRVPLSWVNYHMLYPDTALATFIKWANAPAMAPRLGVKPAPAVPPPVAYGGDTASTGMGATPSSAPAGIVGAAPTARTPRPATAAAKPSVQKPSGKIAAAGIHGQKPSARKPGGKSKQKVATRGTEHGRPCRMFGRVGPDKATALDPGSCSWPAGLPANVDYLPVVHHYNAPWSANNAQQAFTYHWYKELEGQAESYPPSEVHYDGYPMTKVGENAWEISYATIVREHLKTVKPEIQLHYPWDWDYSGWGAGTALLRWQLVRNQEKGMFRFVGLTKSPYSIGETAHLTEFAREGIDNRKLRSTFDIRSFWICYDLKPVKGGRYEAVRHPGCGICIIPMATNYTKHVTDQELKNLYAFMTYEDLGKEYCPDP